MHKPRYPLSEDSHVVHSRTGKRLDELTISELRAGNLQPDDLSIHPDTLRAQAEIAEEHGFPQLAANLRRAAELALIPQKRILEMYEALRPYRTSAEILDALAQELEERWQAPANARLVREAAAEYRRLNLG
ncbi:MAG: diol dehydratase small subunit [Anaerolineae bacterium]